MKASRSDVPAKHGYDQALATHTEASMVRRAFALC